MAKAKEKSSLASDVGDLYDYWTPAESRLLLVTEKNPLDYDSWMALIALIKEGHMVDITKIRRVYQTFLHNFPLCLDQLRDLAVYEMNIDGDAAMQVYEKASYLKSSVDFWYHYCGLAVSLGKGYEFVRRLFEDALKHVGSDYHSNILWDSYIRYEENQSHWQEVARIYTRLIDSKIAVQDLDSIFDRFMKLANSVPLSVLINFNDGIGFKDTLKGRSEDDQLKEYIRGKQISYTMAKQYQEKIIMFETSISRVAFNPSPMDDSELGIWHLYLDFIETEGDLEKAVGLYERCLIPCANRADIWMRYIEFLEDVKMFTNASEALSRALKLVEREGQLEICLFSAKFKECIGDIYGARQHYHDIYKKINPGSPEIVEAIANFEHRLGDDEKACLTYEDAIMEARQMSKTSLLPTLLIQYASFALVVLEDPNKSRQLLSKLHGLNLNHHVIKATIDLASSFPENKEMSLIGFLDSLVQKYLYSNLIDEMVSTQSEKREISLIFLEFLDKFGDLNSIDVASKRHMSLFREGPFSSKRKAHD